MAKKKLTKKEEKELKMLEEDHKMLERTRREMVERGADDGVLEQVDDARKEVIDHIASIDADRAKMLLEVPKKQSVTKVDDGQDEILSLLMGTKHVTLAESVEIERARKDEERSKYALEEPKGAHKKAQDSDEKLNDVVVESTMYNTNDPMMQYDVIPLPSNGQGYPSKVDRVPVGYLTAYDENFILSPNLWRDGLVIDFLIKNKVLNKDIDVEELLSGDVDAIILFLRATSYGPDFPIVVRDPQSGEQIESTVDLTSLKYKDFKLVGDENGWFDFETPLRKDKIKFRYLTRKQEKQLKQLADMEDFGTRATMIENDIDLLNVSLASDDVLDEKEKDDITKLIVKLKDWVSKLKGKDKSTYSKVITNSLMMQIMSVNGETDKNKIYEYVRQMPARDARALRVYINENKPGVDFEIEVERPESLGGGSFKTFLNWDDTVFLNVPEL